MTTLYIYALYSLPSILFCGLLRYTTKEVTTPGDKLTAPFLKTEYLTVLVAYHDQSKLNRLREQEQCYICLVGMYVLIMAHTRYSPLVYGSKRVE